MKLLREINNQLSADRAFLDKERARLAAFIRNTPIMGHVQPRHRGVGALFLIPQRMTALSISIAVLLGAGGGTVAAAQNDLPGQALYGLKRATERVELRLAGNAETRAELNLLFAARRMVETQAITEGSAKVEGPVAVEVLHDLKARLQEANENALAAKSEGRADILAELSAQAFVTAGGIDRALERIKSKFSAEGRTASDQAQVEAKKAEATGAALREDTDAAEKSVVEGQAEAGARAGAEGKIGAAEDRLEAAANHVANLEARLSAEAVTATKAKLESARKLIADAKVKLKAKAYAAAFDLAQQSIRVSGEVQFSLEDSVRVLLPSGFNRHQSDERASGSVQTGNSGKFEINAAPPSVRAESESSVEARLKL